MPRSWPNGTTRRGRRAGSSGEGPLIRPTSREHYRIAYPTPARPKLLLGGYTHDVVDISEGGIKFLIDGAPAPGIGEEIQGTVRFRRGDLVDVQGKVLRVEGNQVAAQFVVGIPFKTIMDEQRYLMEHFRGLGW